MEWARYHGAQRLTRIVGLGEARLCSETPAAQRFGQFRAGSAGADRSRDELSDKVAEDFNSQCLRFFDPSAAAPTALDLGGAVARRLLVRSLSFCATCPASDCKVIT